MINNLLFALTLMSALGCGLTAGVSFAFPVFVMKALASLPPAQGIAAMQSINLMVLNPWFLETSFGTAVACILPAVASLITGHRLGAASMLVGSVLYLFGTVLVTIAFNVPCNEKLAAVDATSMDAVNVWARRNALPVERSRTISGSQAPWLRQHRSPLRFACVRLASRLDHRRGPQLYCEMSK